MRRGAAILLALAACVLLCPAQNERPLGSTTSTPAAVRTPAAGMAAHDIYVIRAFDVLTVTVWKQPTLSGPLLVRPDGKISMLLLGDTQAADLELMQLAAQITEMLKKFVKNPQVSVVVSQIHNNYVYLLGSVGKKGPVVMTPGMTLLEAISAGGGLTDFANKKKIYMLCPVDGKQYRFPVSYKKALKGDPYYNVVLRLGDPIVVP